MDGLEVTYALIAATAVVCLLPLFVFLRARRVDKFEPIYWASAYFFLLFVLRPLYDLALGSEFLGELPFDRATARAFNLGLLYAFLSFCLFLVGYYANLGVRLANRLPSLPTAWDGGRVAIAWLFLLGLGSISYFVLVRSFGGWDYYVCHKQETLTAPGQGYLLLGISLISIAFAMKLTQSLESKNRGYVAYGLLLPVLLAIGFFSGSKGIFLMPILVAIVATHYLKGSVHLRHILGLALFVFLLFPIFNTYRNYSCVTDPIEQLQATQETHVGSGVQVAPKALVVPKVDVGPKALIRHAMSRFYGIDSLAIIVRDTPDVMDFQYGKTIVPLFVAWVPRQIWEDKPTVSFGKVFAEKYLGKFFSGTGTSASPTLLGEAYLNWHLPGMLLVAWLSGIAIRLAYTWLIQRNCGGPAIFIYSQFFLYFVLFWEASIAGLLAERVASLIILIAVVFFMGRRSEVDHTPATMRVEK